MPVDLRLYAMVDPEHAGGRALPELARLLAQAARRWCSSATSAARPAPWSRRARAIKAALAPFGVPLLVNDRVDVALAAGRRRRACRARTTWRSRTRGGCSVPTRSSGCRSRRWRRPRPRRSISSTMSASAASMRPPRRTIPIRRSALTGCARIAEALRRRKPGFPICAIAGINAANAGEAIAAGADGVAVISALSLAADPAGRRASDCARWSMAALAARQRS